MNTPSDDPRTLLRRSVYVLLICLGVGTMLGRIAAVDSVDRQELHRARLKQTDDKLEEWRNAFIRRGHTGEELEEAIRDEAEKKKLYDRLKILRPFLSGNDRSRWATLRVLVEEDMRVPGAPYAIDKVIQDPLWDTIDMVKHGQRAPGEPIAEEDAAELEPWRQLDGKHLYSSKPPLLPTLMAGPYWVIHKTTGMTLGTHPYTVGRILLVLYNVLPLVVYFLLLARLIERFGTTDFGRIFAMAAAVFGTFLTTFAVVINNHLPAAVCTMIVLYLAIRIWFDGERRLRYFLLAGLFGALMGANELPALSLFGLLSLALLLKAPKQTLLAYVPAAAVVVAAFFGTNWIAHRSLRPAYMHRSATQTDEAREDGDAAAAPEDGQQAREDDNWYDYEYQRLGKTVESYWNNPVGVDRGEPSAMVYAVNALVGHHGVFSLTPVWILSAIGAVMWLLGKGDKRELRELALLIGAVTMVCLVFYLTRGSNFRNYGGVTSGFRWMFWFAPMWLLTMLPAVDSMAARRWTRGLALAMLIVSVLSASYPTWNPWTHPWLMYFFSYLGWIT